MTVSEKSRLLPKDYQKTYVIPMPPEDVNNNTNPVLISDYDSYALTKDELSKYIDDPFWTRVRYICFSVYWMLCLVALAISCYIAVTALENGFCAGPINGENSSMADTVTTHALPTATIDDNNPTIVFHVLNQPS